jgi:two-component system NarL family sensor kinase
VVAPQLSPLRLRATRSRSALLAWTLWGSSVALLVGFIPLFVLVTVAAYQEPGLFPVQFAQQLRPVTSDWLAIPSTVVTSLAFSTFGALIVTRHPKNSVGWLFCAVGLLTILEPFAVYYAIYALWTRPGSLPGGQAAAWLQNWIWVIAKGMLVVFLPLVFPTGGLSSHHWRPVAWLSASVIGLLTLGAAFHPGSLLNYLPLVKNPLGIEVLGRLPLTPIASLLFVLLLLAMAVSAISLMVRWRRAAEEERQQIKWFVFVVAILAGLLVIQGLVPLVQRMSAFETSWNIAWYLALACLPLATGLAILKYRLYDIDLIINRTLVYGALTTCVIVIYILVVGYLGALLGASGNLAISLLATGVVALLFQPLRSWLQRGVNRLLYGQRDEPYLVVSHLSQQVESSLTHETILPTIVETVAQALKLPYAAIALREGEEQVVAAAYGTANGDALRLPLIYQAEPIGELILSPRAPGDFWTPGDRRLLDEVARQAGMAAHAVQLTGDLQRSRERLVLAREEERRRLRRDLHDGLGPTLGNLTLQLDAVDDLIESDPLAAHELVMKVKRHTQLAIGEIRRLVDDLRPPALDELGLVTALREQAAHYNQVGALLVELDAPDTLPSLPAAVEVAAYRIAVEGLRNAARHAEARRCAICLRLDDVLIVEIVDDGKGLPAQARPGVGMGSMRERAAELGGTCTVEPAPLGGVRIVARLPLPEK